MSARHRAFAAGDVVYVAFDDGQTAIGRVTDTYFTGSRSLGYAVDWVNEREDNYGDFRQDQLTLAPDHSVPAIHPFWNV